MPSRKGIKDKRKKQLTQAAMRCIIEKGYDQVTLEDVCKEVGMSRGITCYYFSTKQDLLVSVLEKIYEDANEVVKTFVGFKGSPDDGQELQKAIQEYVTQQDPILLIQAGVKALIQFINIQPEVIFAFLEFASKVSRLPIVAEMIDKISNRVWDVGEAIISEGIRRGLFHDRDPRMATQLLISSGVGIMQGSLIHKEDFFSLEAHAAEIYTMVLNYLSAPAGGKKGKAKAKEKARKKRVRKTP